MNDLLLLGLKVAGASQLILVVGSFGIPKALGWKAELKVLPGMMRQLWWTYSGYVLMMHLFFGLMTFFHSHWLVTGSEPAAMMLGLMLVWWGIRLCLQFFCFDRSFIPDSLFHRAAEKILVCLFVGLVVVYVLALVANLRGGEL